jgi:hypothetical protein
MNDKIDPYKELHRFSNDLERAEILLVALERDISVLEKELSNRKIERVKVLNTISSAKMSIAKVADSLVPRAVG